MASEVDEFLKYLDNDHHPDDVPNEDFVKVPDGTYQTRLDKIYIAKSKGDQPRMQTTMEFEVQNGPSAYKTIKKWCGMETSDQLDWLTKDIRRLGIESFTWTNLQDKFHGILDNYYEIKLVTKKGAKGDFQNVYIQKKLNRDDVLVAPQDDDIPF